MPNSAENIVESTSDIVEIDQPGRYDPIKDSGAIVCMHPTKGYLMPQERFKEELEYRRGLRVPRSQIWEAPYPKPEQTLPPIS